MIRTGPTLRNQASAGLRPARAWFKNMFLVLLPSHFLNHVNFLKDVSIIFISMKLLKCVRSYICLLFVMEVTLNFMKLLTLTIS